MQLHNMLLIRKDIGKVHVPILNLPLMHILSKLSERQLAWIAGFLDGDGHIGCRIVSRPDYRNGFKLSPEISFTQKTGISKLGNSTRRGSYLLPIIKALFGGIGSIRIKDKNKANTISVYEIQGLHDVYAVLWVLLPYLVLKAKQAKYNLDIIANYEASLRNPSLFLDLCYKADRISQLNDSRGPMVRTVTAAVVRNQLKSKIRNQLKSKN